MRTPNTTPLARLTVAVLLLGALAGCSAKSDPTAPTPPSGGTPPAGGSGTAWTITVNASPSTVNTPPTGSGFSGDISTVTVTVRNSLGNPPPDGTTISVTASGGFLDTIGAIAFTANSLTLSLVNGQASFLFRPIPADVGFTATITARLSGSVGSAGIQVVASGDLPVFHLTAVDPSVGDPSGGFRVAILGQNFRAPIRVLFGGTNAPVVSVNPTRAVVEVPPLTSSLPVGSTLPITVTVTNAIGTLDEATDSLPNGFIYANGGTTDVPQIFTITPTTGTQEGGTAIVINGSHFQNEAQVIFRLQGPGGTIDLEAPTNFVSSTRLEALSPDIRSYIAAGTLSSPFNAQVRVVNPNGATAVFSGQFTYGSTIRITAVGPGQGPYTGGTRVTIHGSGFDEPVAVSLGGIGQAVVSVSGTEIIFQTIGLQGTAIPPCGGQTTLSLSVTNLEGGASATGGSFTFIGPPNPIIFGINPNSGGIGTAATVTGQNFEPPVRVLFGGADGSSAPLGVVTSSSIAVTVPTPPPSFTFNTVACDGNGDNIASGTRNIPTPISVTVRNLASLCESTLPNAFTLNPSDVACNGDTSSPPVTTVACNDGVDNDSDGFIDFPADAGCTAANDADERTQCQDGIDNEAAPDGLIDFPTDPGCTSLQDTVEN
jgi:hypothetical protein